MKECNLKQLAYLEEEWDIYGEFKYGLTNKGSIIFESEESYETLQYFLQFREEDIIDYMEHINHRETTMLILEPTTSMLKIYNDLVKLQ